MNQRPNEYCLEYPLFWEEGNDGTSRSYKGFTVNKLMLFLYIEIGEIIFWMGDTEYWLFVVEYWLNEDDGTDWNVLTVCNDKEGVKFI